MDNSGNTAGGSGNLKQEIGKLVLYSSGVGQQDSFLNDGLFDDDFQLPLPPPSGAPFEFPGGQSPRLGETDELDLFGDNSARRHRSESLGMGHASPFMQGMPARAQRVESFGTHTAAGHHNNSHAGQQDTAAASPAGFISNAVSATGDLLASGVQKLKASFAWSGSAAGTGVAHPRQNAQTDVLVQSSRSYASASGVGASTRAVGPGLSPSAMGAFMTAGIPAGQEGKVNGTMAWQHATAAAGNGHAAGAKRAAGKSAKRAPATAAPVGRAAGLHMGMQVDGAREEEEEEAEMDYEDVDTGLGSPGGGMHGHEYGAVAAFGKGSSAQGVAANASKKGGKGAGGRGGATKGSGPQPPSAEGTNGVPAQSAGKKRSLRDSGLDEDAMSSADMPSGSDTTRAGKLQKGVATSSVASGLNSMAGAAQPTEGTALALSRSSGHAGPGRGPTPAVLESLLLRQGDPTRAVAASAAAGSSTAAPSPTASSASSTPVQPATAPAAPSTKSTGSTAPSTSTQRGKGKQQGSEASKVGGKGAKAAASVAAPAASPPTAAGPHSTQAPHPTVHAVQAHIPGMHGLMAPPSAREALLQAQLQQQARQLDGLIAENAALREHLRRLDQQGHDAVATEGAQPGTWTSTGAGSASSAGASALASAQGRDAAGKAMASRPAVAAIAGAQESDRQVQLSKLLSMVSERASDADVARAMAEYKDTWGDFGKERWNALRWHLRSLKGLLLPNQITRLCMWSIEHADDAGRLLAPSAAGNAADASGITSHAAVWQTICSICQISPEQSARLLSLRHSIQRARRDFTETLLLLRGLEEKVTHNFTSLEMHMTGLMSIMTPRQAAIFLQWNEGSERLFQMLPSLAAWPIQLNAQGQPIFNQAGPSQGAAASASASQGQALGAAAPAPAPGGGLAALLPAVLQAALGGMAPRATVTAAPGLPGSATGAVLLPAGAASGTVPSALGSGALAANVATATTSSAQSVTSDEGAGGAASGGTGGGRLDEGWCGGSGTDPTDPTDVFRVC